MEKDVINSLIRVMVIDDQGAARDMVRAILKTQGFRHIVTAEDGDVALKKLRESEEPFGLIICDWNMPSMPGIVLLREVRKDERLKEIPFLMLTAEAYRENVTVAMELGVSDYVAKPFTAHDLSEKVHRLLHE